MVRQQLKDYFNINCIFFDVVGTLLFPHPAASRVYYEIGKHFGSRLALDAVHARFRRALRRQEKIDEQAEWRTNEEREQQRWRDMVTEVLDDVNDQSKCFETLFDHFAKPEAWRAADDAESVLARLHDQGFALGLATNFDKRLRSLLKRFSLFREIQFVAISSEIGWRKPAEQFFQSVVGMTKTPPGKILLVGDDYRNDYQGGRAAGLQTLLLQPVHSDRMDDGAAIASLSEIVDLSAGWKSEE